MKLLMFQARRFWFQPFSKTLADAEDAGGEEEVREAVVVFLCAEAEDESKGSKLLTKALKNIKWLARKRGLERVVLHSFAHLSASVASADFAGNFIETLGSRLTDTGYEVRITPFGYFCEWDLSVYGESLAKVYKEL